MPHATPDEMHTPQPPEAAPPARLLRLPEVIARVGLRRSAIYQRMSEGRFPKSTSLGAKCAVWLESDIERWIRSVTKQG